MRIATVLAGTVLAAAALTAAWGQTIKLPDGGTAGDRAENSFEVTMDKGMLQLAGRFLSGKGDEAKTKRVLEGLESVYVRSFTFAREGEYNPADLDTLRAQFQAPAWSRIAGVRSKQGGENVDIFLKDAGNGRVGGAVLIATEPRELTFINITGTLDPADLADLGGQFHIPHVAINGKYGK
jgi:hypothetical protein